MNSYQIPLWKEAPFVRLILPIISGIYIQWYFPIIIYLILLILAFSFCGIILFYFLKLELRFRYKYIQSIFIYLYIFSFALLLTWNRDLTNQPEWFGNNINNNDGILVNIEEPIEIKDFGIKAIANVCRVINKKKSIQSFGKLLVFFKNDEKANKLNYGDMLLIFKSPQPITNNGNPGSFDNKRYQAFQQIYFQVYVQSSDYHIQSFRKINWLKQQIIYLRTHTISVLQKNIKNETELGIAEALLIGYKNDLDKELVKSYSNTGVIHIIAISGLHLGIIYIILVWIFNRLPIIKKSVFIKSIGIIICLWLFTLLTGASASVLRSAVMFTFVIIGKMQNREVSIYNSLAASAFVLLCYNPYFLWDVGFQLSYLALIGIVWLQKPIELLWSPENYFLKKIWEMSAITSAAQIITFPICLYYFHQFPNLFLISNLLAVPLSTIILFEELILLCFSWNGLLEKYIGLLIEKSVWLLNSIIIHLNEIPYSVCKKIFANEWSTILLYGVIICLIVGLLKKEKRYLKYSSIFSILFFSATAISWVNIQKTKKIIVYNSNRNPATHLVNGKHCYCLGTSFYNNNQTSYYDDYIDLESDKLTESNDIKKISQHKNCWIFGNKSIVFIDSSIEFKPINKKIKVDFVIFSKNAFINIEHLTVALIPQLIIFDATNSKLKIKKWEEECVKLGINYFSVKEKGAFVYEF